MVCAATLRAEKAALTTRCCYPKIYRQNPVCCHLSAQWRSKTAGVGVAHRPLRPLIAPHSRCNMPLSVPHRSAAGLSAHLTEVQPASQRTTLRCSRPASAPLSVTCIVQLIHNTNEAGSMVHIGHGDWRPSVCYVVHLCSAHVKLEGRVTTSQVDIANYQATN